MGFFVSSFLAMKVNVWNLRSPEIIYLHSCLLLCLGVQETDTGPMCHLPMFIKIDISVLQISFCDLSN